MVSEEEIRKQYSIVRLISLLMLVVAPIAYAGIVYVQAGKLSPRHANSVIIYGALAVALVESVLVGIFDRSGMWVRIARQREYATVGTTGKAQAAQIARLAFLESIYIFGMIVFFMTGTTDKLIYFAVIGVVSSIIYWPTYDRFEQLVKRLEKS